MTQEEDRRRLKRLLAVVSLVAGVVWVLAAFAPVPGADTPNMLYLALGVVFLIGNGLWFLGLKVQS